MQSQISFLVYAFFFFLIKGPEFEDVQFMVMENKRKLI